MWLLAWVLCLTCHLAHVYSENLFYSENLYGTVGENFTFPVQIDQKMVESVWKKNRHKVAEWEGQNKPTYFDPLRNRSVLVENGSLTIFNLEKDDAGPYELQYRYSGEDRYFNFQLFVLDSLPEPKISCNISDGELVLNCTADFQGSLNYTWNLSNDPRSYPNQELSIPLEKVDTINKATCVIKFSQTEKSSEISLIQCHSEQKGYRSSEQNGDDVIGGTIVAIIAAIAPFVTGGILCLYGKCINRRQEGTAQNNGPVNGAGEHEFLYRPVPGNNQQQPNSEGATFSHAVHSEDEEPEADRALNEDDGALKGKQIVKNGVNQKEVAQDAECENGGT